MLGRTVASIFAQDIGYYVVGIGRNIPKDFPGNEFKVGDLTNSDFINNLSSKLKPDIVIHCAAVVDVDACEQDRKWAYELHVQASKVLAQAWNSKFIYISTDSVFDGKKGLYTEKDLANPLNYYAETKWLGESAVLEVNNKALVIRVNIVGFHYPPGKSLIEWALGQWKEHKTVNGFDDVYFNPLTVNQLSRLIKIFEMQERQGIVHCGSSKSISKYTFLTNLATIFDYDCSLVKASSVDSIQFKAPRPKNTSLKTDLMSEWLGSDFSLEDGLSELKKNYENIPHN